MRLGGKVKSHKGEAKMMLKSELPPYHYYCCPTWMMIDVVTTQV